MMKRTLEHNRKISEALKGNKNCFGKKNALGRKHTEEWKRQRSSRKSTKESREKTSKSLLLAYATGKKVGYWKGKTQPRDIVEKRMLKLRGENSNFWKGGITPTYKIRRNQR